MFPDVTRTAWRKSSYSASANNCIEVACLHDASWHKSSHSNGSGGNNCVEVATAEGTIGIRDTKQHGTGPILTVPAADFAAFVTTVADSGHRS